MIGKAYLVGAGPGDADLITVKALRLIQQADVILYDRLIPQDVLAHAQKRACLIDVGKQPTKHRLSQDEINALIVEHALAGRLVVRLKGGDPFVFGRGSEEALVCAEAGIPFEVVPGVSSAFAVPAYAGIPLTHRQVSSAFTVITGHEDPTQADAPNRLNYAALAQQGGTLVVLMGAKQFVAIAEQLILHGKSPDTPAAIVEWGCTPHQRTLVATLETLPRLAMAACFQPPSTIVVGEVVALREMGVAWFAEGELLPL